MPDSSLIVPSVELRKLEPDDLPLLYQWENDANSWLDGDTHNPLSHEDLREYILRTTGDIYQDGQLRLIICPSPESEPVGCVDLYDVDIRNRKAAVAIYVSPDSRRSRVGKKALDRLVKYASKILCFRMLYAFVREDNQASCGLFRSAGFRQVAVLPNWINEGNILVLQTTL